MAPLERAAPGVWIAGPQRSPDPPTLCLPGFLGDARVFGPLARTLAGRRRLVALDLPPGAPREAAAALIPLLDRHLGQPAHALTGSFGGLVARCLPPDRLLSLAAVATVPSRAHIPAGIIRRRRLLGALPGPVVAALYRRHLRRSLGADGVPPALAQLLAERGLAPRILLGRLDGILAWDLPPWPEIPLLWLAGATDPQVRWTPARALSELPAGALYAHVPGGHRPYASHPAPLADRLVGWWRSGS